ncbi:MAG TPA: galactosyltransferase-related protein [Ramlibacter sp.]|nr:galactosyltransferase-related protein [Ramlibacter sp.]
MSDTADSIRTLLGVAAKDLPRYMAALSMPGRAWLALRNRGERLEAAPDASGFRCDWQWTSELHAPKVLPGLGKGLMRRALASHPIGRGKTVSAGSPGISFLIGHRGMARLPHLLATIESIAAQQAAAVECLVVEQDAVSQLGPHLPGWVRLVHTPPPAGMPYCRAWSFNIAAQHARAPVVVLHDNDMMVPADYAAQVLRRIDQGYEVVNLKRFIFYLSQPHSDAIFHGSAGLLDAGPVSIVQNLEGGGSVAITREGLDRIGGMDESFVGWGGEDNDFWERAQLLRVWPWANLPIVHLSHAAQPGKQDAANETARHYRALAQIDPSQRVAQLRARAQGQMDGPAGWPRPAKIHP